MCVRRMHLVVAHYTLSNNDCSVILLAAPVNLIEHTQLDTFLAPCPEVSRGQLPVIGQPAASTTSTLSDSSRLPPSVLQVLKHVGTEASLESLR